MSFVEKILKENPHVHIHDDKRAQVEETIRSLINDGRSMLHVVADFDFTLTMFEKNGVLLPSTFGVIERNDRIAVSYSILFELQSLFCFSYLMVHYFEIKPEN
jgi:hypothetical protein